MSGRWASRPWQWVVVAAGIATVVCLVGWPRPTLWVLGAIATAVVLALGARRFLTERRPAGSCGPECAEGHTYTYRCALKPPPMDPREILGIDRQGRQPICGDRCTTHPETVCTELPRHRMPHGGPLVIDGRECGGAAWGPDDGYAPDPDASGRDPETARTHLDATGEQDADQRGDDPDTLRNRLADAIRTALKARTVPAAVDFLGRPIRGTEIGLTEYDLADVALAAIQDAYVPPPPGSDRDALPEELRAFIQPHMPEYLSTACETAHACQRAVEDHPERAVELRDWARREHASCRLTRKQDMAGCGCSCHPRPVGDTGGAGER